MQKEPLAPALKKKNWLLAFSLVAFIIILVLLALGNISPEHSKNYDSIFSGMK